MFYFPSPRQYFSVSLVWVVGISPYSAPSPTRHGWLESFYLSINPLANCNQESPDSLKLKNKNTSSFKCIHLNRIFHSVIKARVATSSSAVLLCGPCTAGCPRSPWASAPSCLTGTRPCPPRARGQQQEEVGSACACKMFSLGDGSSLDGW